MSQKSAKGKVDPDVGKANEASLTMSALSSPFLIFFCLSFVFSSTQPHSLRRVVFVVRGRLQSDPSISSIKTSTMISNSNSLRRERDAPTSARRSTSHHTYFRAVPRANRTLPTLNIHNDSATSSTSEPPACGPLLPATKVYGREPTLLCNHQYVLRHIFLSN